MKVVYYRNYLNVVIGFLSVEKTSAEFRTPLWEILAMPLLKACSAQGFCAGTNK